MNRTVRIGSPARHRRLAAIAVLAALACAACLCLFACGGNTAEDADADDAKLEQPAEEVEVQADDADADTAEATGASAIGALSVQDGALVDGAGNAVQLRGISTHGLAWYPDYVNEDCFAELRSWGADVVRLAMYTAEDGGYCTGGSQSDLKALVEQGVRCATDADLYAIIDWHILSDGNPLTYESQAEEFFAEMSEEFADHTNVIYEICNEPNGASWADIKSYAEDIIPVIRDNDADAVILVGTPTWSQELDQAVADPITGFDNIMYTLHFYAATHKDSLRATLTSAVEAGLPVFVSEFGICDASGAGGIDEESADAWVELLDGYGISYVAWNLSNKDETSAIIKSSVSKTSGFTRDDLSDSGQWLYDLLGSQPGTVTAGAAVGTASTAGASGTASASAGAVSSNGKLGASVQLVNSWEQDGRSYYQYTATVTNNTSTAANTWSISVKFNESLTLSDSWNGSYAASGKTLKITAVDYNAALAAGQSAADIGFIVSGSSSLKAACVCAC